MFAKYQTIDRILSTHYTLPNGKLTNVFVKNKSFPSGRFYDCLLCSVHLMGTNNLIEHEKGKRHQENVKLVDIETTPKSPAPLDSEDRRSFKRKFNYASRKRRSPITDKDSPVLENERKTSKLQRAIDEIKDISIIGLEYILDVQSDLESSYHCVLCQQLFEGIHRISDVVEHLTSYNHRLLYLKKFFPKVFDEVSYLIEIVCEGIESQYSRFNLIVLKKSEFLENRDKFTRLGSNSEHINKNIGCSELIQSSAADAVGGCRSDVKAFVDTISISSETSCDCDYSLQELKDKLTSFRSQMTSAREEILNKCQLYITNPCSYPGYYQMWVTFWNMRIAQLRNGNKLNTTYDWTSEWASEWKIIMNEKIAMDLEDKSSDIQNKLQLKDAMLTDVEKNLMKIPEIVLDPAVKPSAAELTQRPVPPITDSFQNRNSDRASSKSIGQKKTSTKSSKRGPAALGLEQLLEKHKHSGDFMISWRELLTIFGIEDNEIEPVPVTPQTNHETDDSSKKQMDRVDVYDDIAPLEQHPGDPVETVEQLTVISVLSLLLALENMLGSLAPKVIDLLQTAIAMERLKTDSSYALLNDSNNCILFETIKEKFKGLLLADLVAENVQSVVRKAIDDMTNLVQQSKETPKNCYVLPPLNHRNVHETPTQVETFVYVESSLPATANVFDINETIVQNVVRKPIDDMQDLVQQSNETPNKNCYILPPFDGNVEETPAQDQTVLYAANEFENNETNDEVVTLRDSEIKTLMTKFTLLSKNDKIHFTSYLNNLRISDPNRLARLKNDICQNQPLNQTSFLEWEREINYPDDAFYSDSYDYDKSIAYQVARRNASVKIKRRIPVEGEGDILMNKRLRQD